MNQSRQAARPEARDAGEGERDPAGHGLDILSPGRNCWRVARAQRVAVLVDAHDYFAAFAEAVQRARRSVIIVGWDFNGGTRLWPEGSRPDLAADIAGFLAENIERRRSLHVNVLDWDFPMLYAMDREFLPSYRFAWRMPRRFHFQLDPCHPIGGAHHQKIVVVDDAIAFVGGMDIAACRWDTSEHLADDPRRVDRDGEGYPPVHDVQMLVDGEAAAALAAVVRERWLCATGHKLPRVRAHGDPWPTGVTPDFRDVEVGVARTFAAYDGRPEVREIEALYVDAIAAARRYVYIENQYLTAARIGDAIIARLREPEGPEIVVLNPSRCAGWLEETTMGVLRARMLRKIRAADAHGRFRIYSPTVPDLGDARFNVHSKLMIVDGDFLRVGSANLNNRSMGLDSECDLALEARDGESARGVDGVMIRLLAEHLGVPREDVAATLRSEGSLIAAIEKLRGRPRTLVPCEGEVAWWLDEVVPDAAVVDPERPIPAVELQDMVAPLEEAAPSRWPWLIGVALVAGVAALWIWGPVAEWLDPDALGGMLEPLRESAWAPAIVLALFVAGSLVLVPVTVMIVATAAAFGALEGGTYALVGSIASAAAGFGVGRWLGRARVRRLFGNRLGKVGRYLSRHGVLVVTAVRLVPLAPFAVVNLAAGAAHVRLRDFLIGTALGMSPGILGITVFADQLGRTLASPDPVNVVLLLVVVGALLLGGRWLQRRLAGREAGPSADPQSA